MRVTCLYNYSRSFNVRTRGYASYRKWSAPLLSHFPPERCENHDWCDRVNRITAPTLVNHGTGDLIPLDSSKEWGILLPGARLLVIEGSGHYPHKEHLRVD